ncbi:sterol 3-beta-glucosyltransferase [Trichomonascus vanleenenianus]|uniref:sterol 3-beta-glucosyltransferase n=1 Tax=Trichomonascus vanleenenianus TaxID=2268995 RepID=UPI003ECA1019
MSPRSGMLSSTIIPRGRDRSKGSRHKRSSSSDDFARAHPTSAAGSNVFSVLTAAVKNRYNRFDDLEGDADEDDDDDVLHEPIPEEPGVMTGSVGAGDLPIQEEEAEEPQDEEANRDEEIETEDLSSDEVEPNRVVGDELEEESRQEAPSGTFVSPLKKVTTQIGTGLRKRATSLRKLRRGSHTQLESSVHSLFDLDLDAAPEGSKPYHSMGALRTLASRSNTDDTWIKETRAHALTEKLRKQLDLDEDTVFLGEYPCWLLKNILLQGHMYLTNRHVCFFAYLPRKKVAVIKSGSMSKKARRTPKYTRYWFILRNDTLSYYAQATDLYFPSGTIDLRYAVHAEISGDKATSATFTLVTEQRTYYFRADSHQAADYWVKTIEKEIFRSRNEGDKVKIVIPVENIIDLENRPIFEIGETLKIRAIDSDETYAIDEYVLAFFNLGSDAKESIVATMKSLGLPNLDRGSPNRSLETIEIKNKVLDTTSAPKTPPLPPTEPQREQSFPRQFVESLTSLPLSATGKIKGGLDSLRPLTPLGTIRGFMSRGSSPSPPPESSRERSQSVAGTPDSAHQTTDDDERYDILTPPGEMSDSALAFDATIKPRRRHAYTMSVVTKVTEMWEGGTKHFVATDTAAEVTSSTQEVDDRYLVPPEDQRESNERFRAHFSLGESDTLVATYYAHIQKALPIYGKIYLSDKHLCFRSLLPGTRTKMILPLQDIENVTQEKGFRFGYSGLVLVIHGHEEIFFEFSSTNSRDDCEIMVLRELDKVKAQIEKTESNTSSSHMSASYYHRSARLCTYEDAVRSETNLELPPTIIDERRATWTQKPICSKHFTLLTIGSRGDVQPYIALAKGLLKEGHSVRIATHIEFKEWVEKHGIEFREIAGDPGELMKIMVDHGMLSVSFLREASSKFRKWIDQLLHTSWEACQGTDVLIESPSAMAGIHVAEALGIPYFRAFTMPWTRTRAYPHAFIVPEQKMGGSYNYLTYVLFDNVFWKGISGQVNRWRKRELGLRQTSLEQLQQSKVPFLYNVSPSVFVPPVDFSDWITVTGYWFLDEGGKDYEPPEDLARFIRKAKEDGVKLVYIGFGSIVVSDSKELTRAVVKSVQKAGVRCVLSKGWSDRMNSDSKASEPEIPLPPEIFKIDSCPHDWLFPQMDAAVHHGGSGTTGASLRAGLPTIIKPFFADQFFYAGRVEDLGAGVYLRKLSVNAFSKALREVTHNKRIISRAARIGRNIRHEHGVQEAIMTVYRDLEYASKLIRAKRSRSNMKEESTQTQNEPEEPDKAQSSSTPSTDDSWTFVSS